MENRNKPEYKSFIEDYIEEISIKAIVIVENYIAVAVANPTCVEVENSIAHMTLMLNGAKAVESNKVLENLFSKKNDKPSNNMAENRIKEYIKKSREDPDHIASKEELVEMSYNTKGKRRKAFVYIPKDPIYVNFKTFIFK
mmetsp:Transcript_31849/g.28200  ORF Transcript_31849/g.28200 Transcript_31849/m.28200 type:complete len:141 (+) Transcript_31849:250-672(+)